MKTVKAMAVLPLLVLTLTLSAPARVLNVAVPPVRVTDEDKIKKELGLSAEDIIYISETLHRIAGANLSMDDFNVMDAQTVMTMSDVQKKGCADAGCAAEFGKEVGADYVVEGTLKMVQKALALTVTIRNVNKNTNAGNLPKEVRYANLDELLKQATEACEAMFKKFVDDISKTQKKTAAPPPAAAPATVAAAPSRGPVVLYLVRRKVVPEGAGFISQNPSKSAYESGERVTFTASASDGYKFIGWSGDLSGERSAVAIDVDGDKEVIARFEKIITLKLRGSPWEGGRLSSSPDKQVYEKDEPVTVTVTPNKGYTFTGWTGDASGMEKSIMLNMDRAKEVRAEFDIKRDPMIGFMLAFNLNSYEAVYDERTFLLTGFQIGGVYSHPITRKAVSLNIEADFWYGSEGDDEDGKTVMYGFSVPLTALLQLGWFSVEAGLQMDMLWGTYEESPGTLYGVKIPSMVVAEYSDFTTGFVTGIGFGSSERHSRRYFLRLCFAKAMTVSFGMWWLF